MLDEQIKIRYKGHMIRTFECGIDWVERWDRSSIRTWIWVTAFPFAL